MVILFASVPFSLMYITGASKYIPPEDVLRCILPEVSLGVIQCVVEYSNLIPLLNMISPDIVPPLVDNAPNEDIVWSPVFVPDKLAPVIFPVEVIAPVNVFVVDVVWFILPSTFTSPLAFTSNTGIPDISLTASKLPSRLSVIENNCPLVPCISNTVSPFVCPRT